MGSGVAFCGDWGGVLWGLEGDGMGVDGGGDRENYEKTVNQLTKIIIKNLSRRVGTMSKILCNFASLNLYLQWP